MTGVLAIVWARPYALLALAVPLALLLLSVRRARPDAVHVGTFALWREAAESASGERRRWRLPPARVALVAASLAGALALAGPGPATPPAVATWRAVLAPSRGSALPHTDAEGRPTGRGSRLDVAVARLADEARAAGVALEWWRPTAGGLERGGTGAQPPEAWRRPAPGALDDARAVDLPGRVWVSDRAPDAPLERAGFVAGGGGPVPGPIAADARELWEWDGERIVARPVRERAAVAVRGPLPKVLAELVDLWREERGFSAAQGDDTDAWLTVVAEGQGAPAEVVVARDGWSARGRGRAAGGAGETWLSALVGEERVPVVVASPGRVVVALEELEEPAGEPGAFAVSWADLLDGAVAPVGDVAPQSARRAAGEQAFAPPAEVPPLPDPGPDWPWSARLALSAAALAALALALGEGR